MHKAASVSSVPGHTKSMQEIVLDSKVKLLDSPGIVFSGEDEKTLVLRNIIKVEDVKDPIAPVESILERVDHNSLLIKYEIPEFSTLHQFLMNVANKRGKLLKVTLNPVNSFSLLHSGRYPRPRSRCQSCFIRLERRKAWLLHLASWWRNDGWRNRQRWYDDWII